MTISRSAIDIAGSAADRLNPVTAGPAAPLTRESVMHFVPSLMPRSSMHQGVAAALAVIAARAAGMSVDSIARRVAPDDSPLAWGVAARAGIVALGAAVSRIEERDGESTAIASLRTTGSVTSAAALGSIIHEVGKGLEDKVSTPFVPLVTGIGGFAYAASRWGRNLKLRRGVIQRWPADDAPAKLCHPLGSVPQLAYFAGGL